MNTKSRKIKVLFVLPSLKRAGAEIQTIDLINGLSNDLFEKHLLCFESSLELLDQIDTSQVSFHHLQRQSKLDWRLAVNIGRLINRLQIDIVHCSLMIALFWGWLGLRFSQRHNIPLIAAIHTTINRNRRADVFDVVLYQWILRACRKVVFVCDAQKRHWEQRFAFLRFNAVCIHNGIDVQRFNKQLVQIDGLALKRQLNLSERDIIITQIAAFRTEKGHLLLLEAFKRLKAELHNLHLLLAGDGPLNPIISAKVIELGLTDSVHLLGVLADVRPLLAISSVTVLASTAVETFSIAMLESLAMAVPMVATDLGGAREAIISGETGYLVQPGNIEALTDALRQMITENKSASLGEQGRQIVTNQFTRERMLAKYVLLFNDEFARPYQSVKFIATLRNLTRNIVMGLRIKYLNHWGHKIDASANVSFSAFLDKTNPKGIVVGEFTLIAREAMVLSHDYTRSLHAQTSIGNYCLIGARAIVLPGITIGDHVVVGAGSVVTKDIPSNYLAAGNPARPIRKINTGIFGKILADENL